MPQIVSDWYRRLNMFRKLAFAVVLTAITVPAFADTPRLDARERNQRERIAQGAS
jgi:hypothetical protein